jgi:UDP-N-acetylglucosamine transferase subunit ALG13
VIFVTTGTCDPFDRLLLAVDGLALHEELVVQHGISPVRPRGARCVDYLAYEELVSLVRAARVVITHAGVGSVLTALANGKQPIVVPRLAGAGDAIDDHQLEFARHAARAGIVRLVEDPHDLGEALRTGASEPPRVVPDARLVADLRSILVAAAA